MVPIRGREALGERCSESLGQDWDDCPSQVGKGDKKLESKAKRRQRGQNEGRWVCGGEKTEMWKGLLSKTEYEWAAGQTEEGTREERCV